MISCYLDSQDYSVLADPKRVTPDQLRVKETLLYLARSKQVRFAFSAAVVSESAPLARESAHLAELKGELVAELCGSNALVSLDRLIGAEVTALASRSAPPLDMFDPQGQWFPDIPISEGPDKPWDDFTRMAEEELRGSGLSRQQRRARSRALVKNGKPRQALRTVLAQQDQSALTLELLKQYPMRPESAEVMVMYGLGKASAREFYTALKASLLDPRWMMKWFATDDSLPSSIADIIRGPGRELGQLMRELACVSVQWSAAIRDAGCEMGPTRRCGEIALRWKEMEVSQLLAVAQRVACGKGIELGSCDGHDVATFCLGLTACVGSLLSSVWANVGEGRRVEPSDSQPADALHACYAPYVKVFRADRFMAPHIRKHIKAANTEVVPRLSELVGVLDAQLR